MRQQHSEAAVNEAPHLGGGPATGAIGAVELGHRGMRSEQALRQP
jgi:hypothetical protein